MVVDGRRANKYQTAKQYHIRDFLTKCILGIGPETSKIVARKFQLLSKPRGVLVVVF